MLQIMHKITIVNHQHTILIRLITEEREYMLEHDSKYSSRYYYLNLFFQIFNKSMINITFCIIFKALNKIKTVIKKPLVKTT